MFFSILSQVRWVALSLLTYLATGVLGWVLLAYSHAPVDYRISFLVVLAAFGARTTLRPRSKTHA